MSAKEINSGKLFKEFLIEVPYNEIDTMINSKIIEIIPTVSLPGFRKGKAPLNIVRKKYENSVLNEVIEKIVQEKTKKLLDEKKLKAFRQPKVEIKKYVVNEPLELGIKIDLQPEIKIFPFEKIQLKKYSIELDKESVEKNYTSFLNSQNNYEKIQDGRVAKLSDRIIVNISSKNNSVPDYLRSQKNIPIVSDSDYQVLPDISNEILKKKPKIGDILKINYDLNKILKDKKNEKVEFEIEILSIDEKKEFKVDKNYLEKNNLKNEKELKEKVKDGLKGQYENYLREIEKKQLLDILESKNEFEIPEGILEEEFNSIWHRVEHAKKDNKLDKDDQNLSENQLKKRYQDIAKRRVKLAILMHHISSDQKISVSEKELSDGMISYASQYPGQEKQIFDYFKQNPSSVESIRGPILEKKIIDSVLTKTKLETKKISVKEFTKLQENTFKLKETK